MSTPAEHLNDLRLRIVKARDLSAQGKDAEAEALLPSDDELREALIALRNDREVSASTTLKKKEADSAFASMNLQDLFKKDS